MQQPQGPGMCTRCRVLLSVMILGRARCNPVLEIHLPAVAAHIRPHSSHRVPCDRQLRIDAPLTTLPMSSECGQSTWMIEGLSTEFFTSRAGDVAVGLGKPSHGLLCAVRVAGQSRGSPPTRPPSDETG